MSATAAAATSPRSRSPSPPSEPDVFSTLNSLIPPREIKQADTTDLTFHNLLPSPLKLHEDLSEGCGGQLWPAGMTLARYMLTTYSASASTPTLTSTPSSVASRSLTSSPSPSPSLHQPKAQAATSLQDKHIIEIGAGGGLVGLAVAAGCTSLTTQLLLTDQQPMLALMEKNIALNALQDRVEARVYDWGSRPAPQFPTATGHADIVLAADCVYFEPAFPLLLQTLDDLVGPDTVCYFCFKKRRKADMRFIKDLRKRWTVEDVEYAWREQDRRDVIFLLKVTRKV